MADDTANVQRYGRFLTDITVEIHPDVGCPVPVDSELFVDAIFKGPNYESVRTVGPFVYDDQGDDQPQSTWRLGAGVETALPFDTAKDAKSTVIMLVARASLGSLGMQQIGSVEVLGMQFFSLFPTGDTDRRWHCKLVDSDQRCSATVLAQVVTKLDDAIKIHLQSGSLKPKAKLRNSSHHRSRKKPPNQLPQIYKDALPSLQHTHPMYFNVLGSLWQTQFENVGAIGDSAKAIKNLQHAMSLTPDGDPSKLSRVGNMGTAFGERFVRTGALSDINNAIKYNRKALALIQDGRADKALYLSSLATSLGLRYTWTGALSDIDKAIENGQQAVLLTPDGHHAKAGRFNDLGISFQARFDTTGVLSDLKEAIENKKIAVSLTPDGHPDKPGRLSNLGNSLASRFEETGALSDIEEAIKYTERALFLTPDGDREKPGKFNNLGMALWNRHSVRGPMSDLDEAINNLREAVSLTRDRDPFRQMYLSNLGLCLWTRGDKTGNLSHIQEAIKICRAGLALTPVGHPSKPRNLNFLGLSLVSRHEIAGALVDVEEAVKNLREAVALTADEDTSKPDYLGNLREFLRILYANTGTAKYIKEAIKVNKLAVSITPGGHADKPSQLAALASSLETHFRSTGTLSHIDDAIKNYNLAVLFTPDGETSKQDYLSGLGNAHHRRFEFTSSLNDIERAIEYLKKVAMLTPDTDPSKAESLNELGCSQRAHFEITEVIGSLEDSIINHKQAVLLAPHGDIDKPLYHHSLGLSLQSRYDMTGAPDDDEEAIKNYKQSVLLTAIGDYDHNNKSMFFASLGDSLLSRYRRTGALADIEDAIKNNQQAVSLTPEKHVERAWVLQNLGAAFQSRFEHSRDPSDLAEAISLFQLSATTVIGRPQVRFQSARYWALLTAQNDLATASLEAYSTAMGIIRQMAWIGHTIRLRHFRMREIGYLPKEAAAFAIEVGRPDLALEWLEQGRSIVWSQLLSLNTPLEDLQSVHPRLAAKFEECSRDLHSGGMKAPAKESSQEEKVSLDEEARLHHRLAERWEFLVKNIRSLPNFSDFLQPKSIATLTKAASQGQIVTINVHETRCDALVLQAGKSEVCHIPLGTCYDEIQEMQQLLSTDLANRQIRRRAPDDRYSHPWDHDSELPSLDNMLSDLYTTVVGPILEALGLTGKVSDGSDIPRIWWCPTGELTFLPLHAARLETTTGRCEVSDYVVSSYTPTISALLEAQAAERPNFDGLFGFAMTETPWQELRLARLPGAERELQEIGKIFNSHTKHLFEAVKNDEATSGRVLEEMGKRSWMHLACHAVQDVVEPTESGLCLHDRRLKITGIVAKRFTNADLAYLSACETSTGDVNVSDEAVHITAGMLAAGYRGVIGTMWAISDEHAPIVAAKFYERLLSKQEPNSGSAARALHEAVKYLRETEDPSVYSWVPFVHYGI